MGVKQSTLIYSILCPFRTFVCLRAVVIVTLFVSRFLLERKQWLVGALNDHRVLEEEKRERLIHSIWVRTFPFALHQREAPEDRCKILFWKRERERARSQYSFLVPSYHISTHIHSCVCVQEFVLICLCRWLSNAHQPTKSIQNYIALFILVSVSVCEEQDLSLPFNHVFCFLPFSHFRWKNNESLHDCRRGKRLLPTSALIAWTQTKVRGKAYKRHRFK